MPSLRKSVRALLQRGLIRIARRYNYFLVKGILHRVDPDRILRGDWGTSVDVVRNATVELMSREAYGRGIPGAVAEVGVYQGEFAAIINAYFPDRTMYLFDTFDGFDTRDAAFDQAKGYSPASWDFSDTSIDLVMSKMAHPEKVVVRKGVFPETAVGMENETFCLVSLDPDLYLPTYAGLEWFYPRLSPGGWIVVNDYDNDYYSGVREAVYAFAAKTPISITPMPDVAGSMIITKPVVVTS